MLSLSPATADRLLKPLRQPHRLTTTKPGRLLKQHIPVRTFTEWTDAQPGFLGADLVAHCGGSMGGAFLYTLTLTDVATTWTECLPLLHRTQHGVVHALQRARGMFPFPLLGIDTDNGGEFINEELMAYCATEQLTFTRGRVANKNDQCYVEQKNGSVVRQLVGYDRFEGERAYRQLAELYRAVRLYVNFFQPSMKLRTKTRTGSRVRRMYDRAQTPFQRVLASGVVDAASDGRLNAVYWALDPVRLLRQVEALQEALWRHAVFGSRTNSPIGDLVARFELSTCGGASDEATADTIVRLQPDGTPKRKYRRSEKSKGPRTYRTRKDPFETVWDQVCQWLVAQPQRNGRSIFDELQQRDAGQFANGQIRTLQRRIAIWRAKTVLTFDDGLDRCRGTGRLAVPAAAAARRRRSSGCGSMLCLNHDTPDRKRTDRIDCAAPPGGRGYAALLTQSLDNRSAVTHIPTAGATTTVASGLPYLLPPHLMPPCNLR